MTPPTSNSAMTALRVTKLEHEVQTLGHKIHACADVINNLIEAISQLQVLTFELTEKLAPEFLISPTEETTTPEAGPPVEDAFIPSGEVVDESVATTPILTPVS